MIRRVFWMIAGALLGVTGYRRVSRLARAVSLGGRHGAHGPRAHGDLAQGVARFARDVRDGMELYTDRRLHPAGRTLGGQQAHTEGLGQPGAGGRNPGRASPGVDYAKDGR